MSLSHSCYGKSVRSCNLAYVYQKFHVIKMLCHAILLLYSELQHLVSSILFLVKRVKIVPLNQGSKDRKCCTL